MFGSSNPLNHNHDKSLRRRGSEERSFATKSRTGRALTRSLPPMASQVDDDDSAIIVYGDEELTAEATSQTSYVSQTQEAPPSPATEVQCMSRSERRKRRFEGRQLATLHSNSPSPEDPAEDAFTALQKLVQTQNSQSMYQDHDSAKENIKENSTEPDPSEGRVHSPPQQSPPQFSFPDCGQDDDSEENDREMNQPAATPQYERDSNTDRASRPKKRRSGTSVSKRHELRTSNREGSRLATQQQKTHQSSSALHGSSIVGSRPSTWKRHGGLPFRTQPSKLQRHPNRLTKAGALSAATRAPTRSHKGQESELKTCDNGTWGATKIDRLRTKNAALAPSENVEPIRFRPWFLPSNQTSLRASVTDPGDTDAREVSNEDPTFTSPRSKRKRKSSKGNHGPLSRRLAKLLKARSSDLSRIQNPAFSRNLAFDLNDPRKRARSYTDIQVLGSCVGPWAGKDQDTKLTVLVYVHRHVLRSGENPWLEKELAWACFDPATARAINLRGGISLRMYNAQFIPSRHRVRIDPKSLPAIDNTVCRYFLVCTCLSEPYPIDLEPLPEIVMAQPTSLGPAKN